MKACTFFMVPFYYEGEWEEIHKKISRWEPIKDELSNQDILYPYIMDLFKKDENTNPKDENSKNNNLESINRDTPNRFNVYQLNEKDKGTNSQFFFDRILGKRNVAILERTPGKNGPHPILFKFLSKGNNAPHLFVSTSAQIGIMTLCAEFEDGCSVEDLLQFNYDLHKRNETKDIVIGKKTLPDGKVKYVKEKRTSNYRIVCPKPESQKNMTDAQIMQAASQYLSSDGFNQLIGEVEKINESHINWDLNFFSNFLLNSFNPNSKVRCFNKERMHIFTFCSIDDSIPTGTPITIDDITPLALRLSRVVNGKFLLPFDEMVKKGAILKTFDNICFSSAIEGTSMVCIAKDVNKKFINGMQDRLNREYLIIYILVLMQRYTLQSMERRITEYDERNDDDDNRLWEMINLTCKIKVNCYYTDVSDFTNLCQFYRHCYKNLHIPETFKEIDEKIELLKITTDRRMQQLLEEQRQLQKEENTRRQQERERRIEKEKKEERIRAEEKAEHARKLEKAENSQRILKYVLAALTICQFKQSFNDIIPDHINRYLSIGSFVLVTLAIIIFVFLIIKDIVNS